MADYCVLFDNDGTLVDSEPISCRALTDSFAVLGVDLDAGLLLEKYRGWKLANLLDDVCQPLDISLPPDFVAEFRARVATMFETELQPIAGAHDLLERLDCPVAVVSSGPPQKIQQALQVTGLSHFFGERIYSSYDVGVWKPDPQIFLYAAADLGFAPGNAMAVDDSLIGVEAAVGAGMTTFYLNHFNESCPFDEAIDISQLSAVMDHLRDA